MTRDSDPLIISASAVANYVVCPEAWRIKTYELPLKDGDAPSTASHGTEETRQVRREWVAQQDLRSQIREYAKIVYLLLCLITVVVFLVEQQRSILHRTSFSRWGFASSLAEKANILNELVPIPTEILLLLLLLGVVIFIWDLLERASKRINRQSGFTETANVVAVKGSEFLPSEELFSERLGLRGRPDALVKDKRCLIPVLLLPKGKKIRDRHVVELLVLTRLIEDQTQATPPYGVILINATKRQVKVKNLPEKQRWLDSLLDEMRAIDSKQAPAVPAPAVFKCKNCDVNYLCRFRADNKENN